MAEKANLNRRRRLRNETQGRAAPATPKTEKSTETRLQKAEGQARTGQLRVFAGETHEEALTRKNAGNRNVRPEQVAILQGGHRGNIGITGASVPAGKQGRGGLSIN